MYLNDSNNCYYLSCNSREETKIEKQFGRKFTEKTITENFMCYFNTDVFEDHYYALE